MRRRKRRTPRFLVQYLRFALVLAMSGVWYAIRRWVQPRIVFVVYGNQKQRDVYWPSWAQRILPTVFPIGLIPTDLGWGIILATKIAEEEFNSADRPRAAELVKLLLSSIKKVVPSAWREDSRVAVALAGRLPGFAGRAGVKLEKPFVQGLRGTSFAIITAVQSACEKHGLNPRKAKICIVGGAGYTGQFIVQQMAGQYNQIIVLDPNPERLNGLRTDIQDLIAVTDSRWLAEVDIIVNLSGRGDDMRMYAPYLRPGTIVLDDTHPPMHREVRALVLSHGAILYKVVTTGGHLRMIPRLPDFSPRWVPGCLLEALVVALLGWSVLEGSQAEFNQAAHQAGIKTCLEQHLEDS